MHNKKEKKMSGIPLSTVLNFFQAGQAQLQYDNRVVQGKIRSIRETEDGKHLKLSLEWAGINRYASLGGKPSWSYHQQTAFMFELKPDYPYSLENGQMKVDCTLRSECGFYHLLLMTNLDEMCIKKDAIANFCPDPGMPKAHFVAMEMLEEAGERYRTNYQKEYGQAEALLALHTCKMLCQLLERSGVNSDLIAVAGLLRALRNKWADTPLLVTLIGHAATSFQERKQRCS
jgi:S-adenosylmethionine:tRNA-ribosyltransferase-isomerase (queuine synthetase)